MSPTDPNITRGLIYVFHHHYKTQQNHVPLWTPINSYEQNVTEAFFPFIFQFLKLIRVFRNFIEVMHNLFHWGIHMTWHRGHIPLFIHRHGKENRTHKSNEVKCIELHKSVNGYKKIATCLEMPISTIRAMLKKFKATGTVRRMIRQK